MNGAAAGAPAAPPGVPAIDRAPNVAHPKAVRSYLAFDFGTLRVGVASGNTLLGRATPLQTIDAPGDARFQKIAALIAEWRPDALVVGIPCHPDGAPHENTARAERFARQLEGRTGLAVHRVDERYTTVEAESRERAAGGGGRRFDIDAASAALILDQYLQALDD